MSKVAIIGGGPGGYVTAIRLAQYNIDIILFESVRLGGVCLNKGCIPTKAMVKSADLYHEILHAQSFGINVQGASADYPAMVARRRQVVEKLVGGVEQIFKKRQIQVINQKVTSIQKLDQGYRLHTGQDQVDADYVIIATGSQPKALPFLPFDGETVLSSDHLLGLEELPKSLAVIGGGVIGCEFASIYAQLGVEVSIIEFLPSLVSLEDDEVAKRLSIALKKQKIKIHLNAGVQKGEKNAEGMLLSLSNNKTVQAQKVLVAVGRQPVFDIDLQGFELEFDKGAIAVDTWFRTGAENIFAIGDVTAKQMLAHTASKMGLLVADIIKSELDGEPVDLQELEYVNVPRCTFTNPEVASVGLTEAQAAELGEIKTGKFPFAANGKSLGLGNIFGFVKVIANAAGTILGVHIIGPQATELIAAATVLVGAKMSLQQAADLVFAHPTLAESLGEALEDAHGMAVHSV